MTMISYVQSFICTYTHIHRKYHTTSAFCLWFVTHYYFSFSPFPLRPCLFFSSYSLSYYQQLLNIINNCNSKFYLSGVGSAYSKRLKTNKPILLFFKIFFLYVAVFHKTYHRIFGNRSFNADPRPSKKRKADNEEKNIPTTITTNTNKNNIIKQ